MNLVKSENFIKLANLVNIPGLVEQVKIVKIVQLTIQMYNDNTYLIFVIFSPRSLILAKIFSTQPENYEKTEMSFKDG